MHKNHQKESIGVKICSKQQTLKAFFLHGISESVCDKLYQSELLEDYRFAEGEINEDTTVIFSLLKNHQKLSLLIRSCMDTEQDKAVLRNQDIPISLKLLRRI